MSSGIPSRPMELERFDRRGFLKAAGVAGIGLSAAGVLLGAEGAPTGAVQNKTADAPPDKKVRVGVIGSGGRGKFLMDLFNQSGLAKVTAVHDYFRSRAAEAGEKFGVAKERQFAGLDGFRKMLETDVDAVAIASPPYFHPEQAAAAIEAGKHVYLAKPVAVDVAGALNITATGKKAASKNLSLLVDFQTRANEFYQGAAKAIHEGMIGTPVIGQAYYYAGRLNPQADPKNKSPMARLRNWVFDQALSGDIIVEQNIHVIDVANWFLQNHPLKATGTGGRKARVDVGDCWDHFAVNFTYPDEVIIDFSSAQFTTSFDDLCVRLCGAKGTVESHYGGIVVVRAKDTGYKGGNTARIYKEGAATNIQNFCQAFLAGNTLNNAEIGATSTLTAILGRTAAYSGKTVTWDELIASGQKIDAKLDLPTDGAEWAG